MSVVNINAVKAHLRVTHTSDDNLIQNLIDGAEDEAKRYLDRDELPRRDDPMPEEGQSDSSLDPASDSDDLAPSIRIGIFLLVQAEYEAPDAAEAEAMRSVAFGKMRSYRRMGV
jgi:hypothetical protein